MSPQREIFLHGCPVFLNGTVLVQWVMSPPTGISMSRCPRFGNGTLLNM